jgi:hypothetical protein
VLEVVEGMKEASGAALEVVNELLMFEKLAAGMTTIETVPTRIVRFVENAMKQHQIPARAKEINFKLTVDTRDKDIGANIDPIKLTVVFRNLFRYLAVLAYLRSSVCSLLGAFVVLSSPLLMPSLSLLALCLSLPFLPFPSLPLPPASFAPHSLRSVPAVTPSSSPVRASKSRYA